MENNHIIIKHNNLIRSKYSYSEIELKLIIIGIMQINKNDTELKSYSISVRDFKKIANIKNDQLYTVIKKLSNTILEKPLYIPREHGGFMTANWFSDIEYIPGQGKIEFSFSNKLKPYLLQLKKHYTKLNPSILLNLKSSYAIRLYELCKSWENVGEFEISIEEFKMLLGVNKKSYDKIGPMKQNLIEKPLKIIKENNLIDIDIKVKNIKKDPRNSKKVTHLLFLINKKSSFNNLNSFKKYIKENYIDKIIWSYRDNNTFENIKISINKQGKFYNIDNKIEFNRRESNNIWYSIYELVKSGKLKF